jgi:colicin import membrane protein
MSTAVYREPYQLPAGILALAVHGAFFALLYFGFTWRALPPATMSVELWKSLPDVVVAPPVQPVIEKVEQPKIEKIAPAPQPPAKPDIVVPEKKKIEPKPVEKKILEKKPVEKKPIEKKPVEQKPVEQKPVEQKPVEQEAVKQKPDTSVADQQAARERAEQAAAIGRVVDEYTAKIQSKIKGNIVEPPGMSKDDRAEFLVTLLPGGTVLSAKMIRSSSNAAYNAAVERAILKSQPLPLPPDAALFNRFREINLLFKPAE